MFASSIIRRSATRMAVARFSPSSFTAKGCRDAGCLIARSSSQQQKSLLFGANSRRSFSTMPDLELKKRVDTFQDLFVEARLCIEDVVDSAETTYFDEDAEAATEAVTAAVDAFNSIINDLADLDQKNRVLRSNGLKVEQLKGELEMAMKGGH
mmetsp:Transcript_20754/g.34321  ORF Transcript_20754/g.34321 Transcript_20754/m.34321 type:complete len:153 (-) Transcript_20754:185-643(-)|eukprot:CAMPEP_0119014632 /NCGR_PEP_ID=MMETSP1176-20130426/10078_1 /TAXON_ID=265551 /ORGANISM="Synedropsis recta cf, Strain CCMP1620" /LENGTH=152 /DNA_ID=CAMNT_0006967837 /DNA_START=44 /DNA_END=502 /DNA_ORIENTATION=-